MSKERYNQIIDEVYEKYLTKFEEDNSIGFKLRHKDENGNSCYGKGNREMFINKCKTDSKFSEKWGLKIEERELTTVEERKKYDNYFDDLIGEYLEHHETLDKRGVPRKITTITYNNETVESYE